MMRGAAQAGTAEEAGKSVVEGAIVLACGAAVSALLYAEHGGRAGLKWLAKPAASAGFVALALASEALESAYGRLILFGLAFCLAGDVLLILRTKSAFLVGMGAFAAGHLAYVGAFASIWSGFALSPVAAALALAVALTAVLRWLWPHLGGFRAPVAGYCAIIGAMTAMSFATLGPDGDSPYWPAAAGAVLFAVSDIFVARDQFMRPAFINRLWGLPLYYAGQLLLAASVSYGGAARLSG